MRKLYTLLSLSLVLCATMACGKFGTAPANANAAKPANSNAAPATNTAATSTSAAKTSEDGEFFSHEEGGLSFVVPKGWKFEPEGDQGVITTADEALAIFVIVSGEDSLDATVKAIDDEISKIIKNPKITNEPREQAVNGMPGITVGGTGVVEDEPVQWSVDIIQAKKPVIFLSVASEEGNKKHYEGFVKFAQSIKKL